MTSVTTLQSTTGLLRMDDRSRTGLAWVQHWARGRITGLKQRRKRLPPGSPYAPEEMKVLQELLDLEAAARAFTSLERDSLR